MAKRLIINADDYGMSNLTVNGIIRCAKAQVITSTTIMATGRGFGHGISSINKLGVISMGVHLAACGVACSQPLQAPSLFDSTGQFKNFYDAKSIAELNPKDLKTEFESQIEKVKKAKIEISHLDNHQYWIYSSAEHFQVVVELASQIGVPVRYPFANISETRLAAMAVRFRTSEAELKKVIRECDSVMRAHRVNCPDYFWYEFSSSPTKDGLINILKNLPEGTSEILTHPGEDSQRQIQEMNVLLQMVANDFKGIELVSFTVL